MATSTIPMTNSSGKGYCKMGDGTLICWGTTYINIAATQNDRVKLDIPFTTTASGTGAEVPVVTLKHKSYNVQPMLSVEKLSDGWYVFNTASAPNVHVEFYWILCSRWK